MAWSVRTGREGATTRRFERGAPPRDFGRGATDPGGELGKAAHGPPASRSQLAGTLPHPARDMVVIAEWAVPVFRIALLAMTPLVFLRTAPIQLLVGALVVINLVLLYLGWHRRGPYSHGRPGIVFDVLFAVASMAIFAVLLPTRTYAHLLPNAPLPLVNFPTPCAAVLAVWAAPLRRAGPVRALYGLLDVLLVGTLVPLFAGFCLLNGYQLADLRWADLTMQVVPTWIALFVGYAIARIAVDFAASQADLIRAQAEERVKVVEHEQNRLFDWLHSRVLPGLGALALHLEPGRISVNEAATAARDMDFIIREKRYGDLLDERLVRLADIVSFYRRFYHQESDPAGRAVAGAALGGVTLNTETAHLVDRALGGLLSNADKYAGPKRRTWDVTHDAGCTVIRVEDDGPGFPDSYLTQPGSSLYDLRCALEAAGGSLTRLTPASGSGTVMVARIPEGNDGSHPPR